MDEKVPREILPESGVKTKPLQSREGLDVSTGTDYNFHKDVMEEPKQPKPHELASPNLYRVAEHIFSAYRMGMNGNYDYRLNECAPRLQRIMYRRAAHILHSLKVMSVDDLYSMDKMGIQGDFLMVLGYCKDCGLPLLSTEEHSCQRCTDFFSGLSIPPEGITE